MKKTIVITGASRGIGKAIAIELAGKDTNIVINCVNNVDKLNEVKSIIEEKGSVCETFIGDMGNYSDVQKMFDMCLQRFGQVDVLINNAGYGSYGAIEDVPIEEVKRQFDVNLFGMARLIQFVTPGMRANNYGKIVNISSMVVKYGQNLRAGIMQQSLLFVHFLFGLENKLQHISRNFHCKEIAFE